MMFGDASIVSWSKDSIYVSWKFNADDARRNQTELRGYKIRYKAVGSSVVQFTPLLDRSKSDYEITHLHENTNYDICVLRVRQPATSGGGGGGGRSSTLSPSLWPTEASACIKGTTSTDSLSVALGSTFGAFLALGLIVALVFVAKWQHSRRAKKRQQAAVEVAGNGAAARAELNDVEDDDVLRVEIAELDTGEPMLSPGT